VKYYCAICHPNVDQLTQAQLNRMIKCRHGKQISPIKFSIKRLVSLAKISEESVPDETLSEIQTSTGKDKNKGTVM